MKRSVVALAVVLAAGVAIPPSTPFGLIAVLLLYPVTRDAGLRAGLAGAVALCLSLAVHDAVWAGLEATPIAVTAALAGAAVAFGNATRTRRKAAAREGELKADRAVADERLRIAQELHDAVGHDVSLMVVQAQALGATSSDAAVKEGTDAIAALGRRTMGELHRTLQVMRGDDGDEREPAPSLERIGEVLDGARAAGVAITYGVEGAPRPLPPALDATAYRIVQEALTNVVRHAGGAPADVTVRYGDDALELEVRDHGPGVPAGALRPGHGLIGMRERAASFGGALETSGDGGFAIRAVLPYGAAP
jgi:signal transduction histidine kinase